MCELCGCTQYIAQGKEAVLKRAVEIVDELGLTAGNVDDYEDIEIISRFIAPFGTVEDKVYETAAWVSGLHLSIPRLKRQELYQAHVRAFKDIFSRLPAEGDPKHIGTTYHQLEQLSREVSDSDLATIDPEIARALKAVNQVHDNLEAKDARLKKRYGL
ncbi:MAG: hypothetical protein HY665_02950 [Chloroflexi bacterium]|nr:hypothetical protein [Chloroflexota bacterium]